MKTILTFAFLLLPFALLAQDPAEAARSAALAAPASFDLVAWVLSFAQSSPKLTALLIVIGALRPFGKSLSLFLHEVVQTTATPADDAFLARMEASHALKWAVHLLDLVTSIKLVHPRADASLALATPKPVPGTRVFSLLLAFSLFTGCASFSTRIEESNADGSSRVTIIKSRTFFDSKSELTKLRTSHTDKTQSVSLGSLNSEASGTNAVNLVEAAVGAAVKAAIGK